MGNNDNNIYLNKFFSSSNIPATNDNLEKMIEEVHGKCLANKIYSEWRIINMQEQINAADEEHEKSLTLLIENESQKIILEELNQKLTNAALVHEIDMKMAANVQKSLLISKPPETKNYDIAFHYQPFASVSGDFYDFYINKDGLLSGFVLADVSGHGIASSLFTSLAKPIFYRTFIQSPDLPLNNIIEKINKRLIKEMDASDHYLTAVILKFENDIIEYVNAAHPDIIHFKNKSKTCEFVQPDSEPIQGTILGISSAILPYHSYKFKLEKDDVIVLYTDCLNESQNSDGQEFGQEKIKDCILNTSGKSSANKILNEIIDNFNKFIGDTPTKDDLTLVVIKKT